MTQWYIIHTFSGSENRVKQMILDQAIKKNMGNMIENIVVPVIEVPEIKRGKNVKVEKKFMPGYILIQMNMNDEIWHLVKNTPKVTGFLGSESKPKAVSEKEVERIFKQLEVYAKDVVAVAMFDIGEQVIVTDGPFETFSGVIEEIDAEKQKLRVSVSIFGRATPISLDYTQVRKNQS